MEATITTDQKLETLNAVELFEVTKQCKGSYLHVTIISAKFFIEQEMKRCFQEYKGHHANVK